MECSWDDVSQAEAYAHSLAAFKKAFPEFASNDLYLTGESYFGQYGPNVRGPPATADPPARTPRVPFCCCLPAMITQD